MLVSGIIGTVGLIGVLAFLLLAGLALAAIDKRFDAGREH